MDVPHLASGTRLCAESELDDGTVRVVALGPGIPIVEVILIRRAGGLIAYHNRCAHLPVPLNVLATLYTADDALVCDHHGARFRIDDGYCTIGPCRGASLARVSVCVRDGAVEIA